MTKILHGVYGKAGPLAAAARYRAGICCSALGKPEAAHSQWSLCELCWPESKWSEKASAAKKQLPADSRRDLPFVRKYDGPEAIADLKRPPKGGWAKRLRMGDEFFNAGIFEDDQSLLEYWKAMTVTDPSQEKNTKVRPTAEFRAGMCCRKVGREDAARRHFERVLDLYPQSKVATLAREALQEGGQ